MKHMIVEMEEMFNKVGESMMSLDTAAELLAWLNVFGGNSEATVTQPNLHAGIMLAQKKCNLYGGEKPSMDGILTLQKKIKELHSMGKKTPWLSGLANRYGKIIMEVIK